MAGILSKQKGLRRGDKDIQNFTKQGLNDLNNHNDAVTHLGSDILECEVK